MAGSAVLALSLPLLHTYFASALLSEAHEIAAILALTLSLSHALPCQMLRIPQCHPFFVA